MKLEKFKEKDHKKKITIGISVVLVLFVAGIIVYRSFAFYEEMNAFDVIKGQVPDQEYDLMFSFYIKDENDNLIYQETMPEGTNYSVSVTCSDGATGEWDYEAWGPVITNLTTTRTKCKLTFTSNNGRYFTDYIINASLTDTSIKKIMHSETLQTGTNALIDYRYTGSSDSVNNWVYFGCDTNCTEENLYRIIGVIPTQSTADGEYENRVKLIKNNYFTETKSGLRAASSKASGGYGYKWNSSTSNKWESSDLQSKVLNTVFWNSLGNYQLYISPAKWYLGAPAYTYLSSYTTDQYYNIERSSTQGYSKGAISWIGNIGLMYPSDYGYSLDGGENNANWSASISSQQSDYVKYAWLYNLSRAYYEWLISPESTYTYSAISAFYISPNGLPADCHVSHANFIYSIRPVFYLDKLVMYKSGTGTSSDPYRIQI